MVGERDRTLDMGLMVARVLVLGLLTVPVASGACEDELTQSQCASLMNLVNLTYPGENAAARQETLLHALGSFSRMRDLVQSLFDEECGGDSCSETQFRSICRRMIVSEMVFPVNYEGRDSVLENICAVRLASRMLAL
eukprot:COSAG02_NODE_2628_length_8394_cov_3.247016_7_plen_138_part_00